MFRVFTHGHDKTIKDLKVGEEGYCTLESICISEDCSYFVDASQGITRGFTLTHRVRIRCVSQPRFKAWVPRGTYLVRDYGCNCRGETYTPVDVDFESHHAVRIH